MYIEQMVENARNAQKKYEAMFNQEQVDLIVKTAAKIIHDNAEELAQMAVEETGMGVVADKIAKNKGKSKAIWYDLKGKRSMGILNICQDTDMIEIAKPMGVVAAITPTTNPIVTPMSKIMFSLKTKNAVIIAPHPRARKCSGKAVQYIKDAVGKFGVPDNMIQYIDEPSIGATQELMKLCDVVVATGGMAMVKSAYSSGKPSYGVGAGNVQVVFDRNIDFDAAAQKVVTGRTFDNGIICSGEQSIICHRSDMDAVCASLEKAGAHIARGEEKAKFTKTIFPDGHLDKDIIGQSALVMAEQAGVSVAPNTKVIVIPAETYGSQELVAKEKMCPALALFTYDHFEEGLHIARTNLELEGNGHTAAVHSNDQGNIVKAGSVLTVSRLVVNAVASTTAGGSIQNGLAVTNTLGCGSWGNNSISENFTYKHLLNITRVAPIVSRIRVPSDEEIWS